MISIPPFVKGDTGGFYMSLPCQQYLAAHSSLATRPPEKYHYASAETTLAMTWWGLSLRAKRSNPPRENEAVLLAMAD